MTNQYHFRTASESDLPLLLKWTLALMKHEAMGDDIELPLHDNIEELLNEWLLALLSNDSALFIISDDADSGVSKGCILGIIQLAPNSFVVHPSNGLIQMIWVEPETRRTGLAAELLTHMEQTFKNLNIPYCEINYSINNLEAESFWQSKGYQPVSQNCRKFL